MYGIMIAIGLLCAFVCLFLYSKKKGIPEKFVDFVFYDAIASIVIGFGAATVIQSFYNFLANPEGGFHINLGQGMTFMGGLLGGVICFFVIYFIFRPHMQGRVYKIFSIAPCCILLGHAFGRIGCFFAGCCYGREATGAIEWLGVTFPKVGHVLPTQLYEAAFLFIMFAICSFLLLKFNFRYNLSVYLISYGVFRFLIEYLRGDPRGSFIPGISPSQFWSFFMVGGGIALIFVLKNILKKEEQGLLK